MSEKFTIDFVDSNSNVAGKVGRTSVNDDASVRNMAGSFKAAINDQAKKITASYEKEVEKLIRAIIKSSSTSREDSKDTKGITSAQITNLGKAITKEAVNAAIKSVIQSLPKNPGQTSDPAAATKSFEKAMERNSDRLAQNIAKELRKADINIDTKDLQSGLLGIMSKAVPKSLETAIRDLASTTSALKTAIRDIGQLYKAAQGMRSSGGKIDITEIGPVLAALKQMAVDYKDVSAEGKKAKESFSELAKESKDLVNQFSEAVNKLQTKAKDVVSRAHTSAKEDPKSFGKEIAISIIDSVKKSDAFNNSEVGKVVKDLEASTDNLTKFIGELQKLGSTTRREVSSGNIKIEGVEKLLKGIDQVVTSLGNIPKDMGVSGAAKEWRKITQDLSNFSKNAEMVVTTVMDNKEMDKILNSPHKLSVELIPEVHDLYKKVNNTVDRALADSEKTVISPKVKPVVEKIKLAMEQNDVVAVRKGLQKLTEINIPAAKMAEAARKNATLIESKMKVELDTKDFKKGLADVRRDFEAIKSSGAKILSSSRISRVLPRELVNNKDIDPSEFKVVHPKKATKDSFDSAVNSDAAKRIKTEAENNIKRLSDSLNRLQTQIVETLDKQFKSAGNKWAVVKPAGVKDPTKAFSLMAGEKQWTMQIANIERLQRVMKDFKSSPGALVSSYKNKVIEDTASATGTPKMADLMGRWLKTVSNEQIKAVSNIDDTTKSRLIGIKGRIKGVDIGEDIRKAIEDTFGTEELKSVFKKTYAESSATRRMQTEELVKTVALPAARNFRDEATFQTTYGSQRSLPKFVKFETGFEVMYNKMLSEMGKSNYKAFDFKSDIAKVGVRPSHSNIKGAERLAEDMFKTFLESAEDKAGAKDFVKSSYLKAATMKGYETEKSGGMPATEYHKKIKSAVEAFDSLSDDKRTFNEFSKIMKALNVSAYDVMKALNSIDVKNVYDVMGDVLTSGDKRAPLKVLAERPTFEKSIRDVEQAIGEVVGLTPILEGNRPRRGYHQENVVNLMTRTSPVYKQDPSQKIERLDPESQKELIRQLNLEFNDTLDRIEKFQGPGKLPAGLRRATSLGIPESQAGNIEEYRNVGGTGNLKFLKNLEATSVKLYAEDLTSLAPFQQFQQAGRNISNVTNAMANLGERIETPKLRSEREAALIESGRYGNRGYGYNVTSELRATAANFEDQIVISGKLAKALTTAVSTLVKPGQAGRVSGGMAEERITGTGVTEMLYGNKSQTVRATAATDEEIMEVSKKYMDILGVPEEYKGRADKALIDNVRQTISVIKGEKVEVQEARLAETFMNYFGRKLTTRYGSKGVSVTPTGQDEGDLSKILSSYSGKSKVKIDPDATLGYQVAPKSLGKMAAELFGDAGKDIRDELITSGNKFMIDIFHNADIVDPAEAQKTKELYEKFAAKWQEIFENVPVPEASPTGVSKLREAYTSHPLLGKSAYTFKPIDVRISSYGAAKRGLQTEFMESIFNNVAGTGPGGVTTL